MDNLGIAGTELIQYSPVRYAQICLFVNLFGYICFLRVVCDWDKKMNMWVSGQIGDYFSI